MAIKCLTDNAADADERLINSIIESSHETLCAKVEETELDLGNLFGFIFCLETDISLMVMPLEKRASFIAELRDDVPEMFGEIAPWLCQVDSVEAMGMLRCVVGYCRDTQRGWARVRVQIHEGAQA